MTIHDPAALARARSLAVPISSCLAAGLPVGHLTGDATRDELAALVSLLGFAADPVRLRAVIAAEDGATAELVSRKVLLRGAHAQYQASRRHPALPPDEAEASRARFLRAVQRARSKTAAKTEAAA